MSEEAKIEQREDATVPAQPRGWRLGNLEWLKSPPIAVAAFAYLIATLFALAVLVLVAFGLFAAFQIAYETAIGKFADRIEAAKVFFPILLALVGGPLLIWRVITAHIQAQATRHQAETGREAHYTSLFTKAVEQLGVTREVKGYREVDDGAGSEATVTTEPNLEVRVGAIYALERIALDSERDNGSIMEVLGSYVSNPQNCNIPVNRPSPRVDVAVAIDVIGRCPRKRRSREMGIQALLAFNEANLRGANLYLLDFSEVVFVEGSLENATLIGADLRRSAFLGTKLTKVSLEGAKLDGALFFQVDRRNAEGLTPEQLATAFGDRSVVLPKGWSHPPHWIDRTLAFEELFDYFKGKPSWLQQ